MSLFNRQGTSKTYMVNVSPVVLKPGDLLVLQTERRLSRHQFQRLRAQIQDQVSDCRIIVLEAGLKVGAVVSKEDIDRWEGEGGSS